MRASYASLLAGAIATAVPAPLALAQTGAASQEAPSAADARLVRITSGAEGSATRQVTLGVGKAAIVELPTAARDVVVSNPDVADAVLRTAQRVFLIGRKLGQTSVFFFDAEGRRLALLELRVEPDPGPLNEILRRVAPDARVRVEAINGAFLLTGSVRDAAEADRVVQLARRFAAQAVQGTAAASGAASDPVVNMLTIEGRDQVLVRVRIVEMNRTLVKQLGVNLDVANMINQFVDEDSFVDIATSNGFSIAGAALGGLDVTATQVQNRLVPNTLSFGDDLGFDTQYLNAGQASPSQAGVGGFDLQQSGRTQLGPARVEQTTRTDLSLKAFERAGLLRVLAEPNLTAISGEYAKFLAGGEFPVPVAAEDGQISVEFKPFGVGLGFTPVVLSGGRISLKLSTEVSELTAEGAINTAASGGTRLGGVTIPGLQVRRAETTVELPSGGAIVMAGLIQERSRSAIEGLPGAKDLPVLGALFRSRDFISNESELVIIVTPYIVKPSDPDDLRTPADGFANASDLQALFSGRLNAVYRTPVSDTGKRRLTGPLGFVLPEPRSTPRSDAP